jgi:histone H3/H4
LKSVRLSWPKIIAAAENLSQAEIVRAADDAVKTAILDERKTLATGDIVNRLEERHAMRTAFLHAEGNL